MQRKFTLSYARDKERKCYIQREGKFLVYTNNCEQKATIGTVKLTFKIPLHDTMVLCQLRYDGPIIEEHMAYFITDQQHFKGKRPKHQHN